MLDHPGVVPLVVAQDNVLYKTARGLAVIQLIIGILSVPLGIATAAICSISGYSGGQGIWGGVWISVTGIIGMASSKNSSSCCVTGTYMAFSIVSTVLTFPVGFLSSMAISFYSNCDDYLDPYDPYDPYDLQFYRECILNSTAGLGLFIPLLLLMIIEFFVSIVAAVYSCKSITCCCRQQQQQIQPGMIITQQQQQQQYQVMPSNQGQIVIASPSGYPVISYPDGRCATTGYYQPQYSGYPQHVGVMSTPGQMCPGQMVSQPHTGAMYVSSQGQPISAQTNLVYSAQPNASNSNVAPPPYDSQLEEGIKNTITPP